MKIMLTYYGLKGDPIQKVSMHSFVKIKGGDKTAQFKYNITLKNHFKSCHSVDDHNNLIQAKLSLE